MQTPKPPLQHVIAEPSEDERALRAGRRGWLWVVATIAALVVAGLLFVALREPRGLPYVRFRTNVRSIAAGADAYVACVAPSATSDDELETSLRRQVSSGELEALRVRLRSECGEALADMERDFDALIVPTDVEDERLELSRAARELRLAARELEEVIALSGQIGNQFRSSLERVVLALARFRQAEAVTRRVSVRHE